MDHVILYGLPLNQSNYIKTSPYQLPLFTELTRFKGGNICSDIETERSEGPCALNVRTNISYMDQSLN